MIPENLDTPEFRNAWAEWELHRKQIKKKLTPLTAEKQLKKLSRWGVKRAICAIERSIENGWQGLFDKDDAVLSKSLAPVQELPAPPAEVMPVPAPVEEISFAQRKANVARLKELVSKVGRPR